MNINDGTLHAGQSPSPGTQGARGWLSSAWDSLSSGAAWVGGEVRDGAVWVEHKGAQGAAWVGTELHSGYSYVAGAFDSAWKTKIRPALAAAYHFTEREYMGIWCLMKARDAAYDILSATVLEETGYELADMLTGVVSGLIDSLIQIGVITLIGGVVGGAIGGVIGALAGAPAAGVGAIPGAIAGAAEGGALGADIGFEVGVWYVTIIGLKFLVDALTQGFKEMYAALRNYVLWAWAARDMGPALRDPQIKRAGKELARAFGVLMRFVLLALILYVTKKMLELGPAKGMKETTSELRKSSLGGRFAQWFQEKFPELKRREAELRSKGTTKAPELEETTGRNGQPAASKAADSAEKPVAPKRWADPTKRPKYGKGQVEKVWENAKQSDGKVYDPNTGEELKWNPDKSRSGQWDMGHRPGEEYRTLHKEYMDGKISEEEFLRRYRDPDNYQPENPSENRSHRHEAPDTSTPEGPSADPPPDDPPPGSSIDSNDGS